MLSLHICILEGCPTCLSIILSGDCSYSLHLSSYLEFITCNEQYLTVRGILGRFSNLEPERLVIYSFYSTDQSSLRCHTLPLCVVRNVKWSFWGAITVRRGGSILLRPLRMLSLRLWMAHLKVKVITCLEACVVGACSFVVLSVLVNMCSSWTQPHWSSTPFSV